jgi:hypothetical protein
LSPKELLLRASPCFPPNNPSPAPGIFDGAEAIDPSARVVLFGASICSVGAGAGFGFGSLTKLV